MSLAAMKEKRAGLIDKMSALVTTATNEGRDLTAEEAASYEILKTEATQLATQIVRAEEVEGLRASLGSSATTVAARNSPGATASASPKEFETLGEFLATVARNPNDARLTFVEGGDARAEQRMDDGPSGGFMVPTRFVASIMQVNPQEAIFRPRAQIIPAGDPPDAEVTMPALDQTGATPANVYGGVAMSWIGEGDTKPETGFSLRQISLKPKEIAGHITLTDKLLRNWQAAGTTAETLLRQAVLAATEDAYLKGNGVGKPLGILNAGATYYVPRTTAGTILTADIDNMVARMLMRGGSPVWLATQSALPKLRQLKDEGNNRIWANSLVAGSPPTLAGYPVLWHERSPLLGVKGDLVLADLSYYLIKDGSGPFVQMGYINDDFVKNKSRMKIFFNVDGQPWLTAPFKQESGYEVSPFVALDLAAG